MANKIQTRRDTAAVWASINPTLADGELAIETDTRYLKFGDGVTPWNLLGYVRVPTPGSTALAIAGTPATTGTVGTAYSASFSASGGTAPYVFALASGALPAGVTLNTATGLVSGTPTAAGGATFAIRVTDSTSATATSSAATVTISAGGSALAIGGTPATTGNIGNAYSATFTASNGTAPYTYSSVGTALPAGLTLNPATGAISGQPTTAGATAGIQIRVTDNASAIATSAAFTITVAAAMQISGTPATTGQVGVPYSFTPAVSGGVGTKTFSLAAGTLPAGVTLNTATGVISGTPTTAAAYAGIQLRVTDSATTPQTSTLAAFTITVAAAAPNTRARFGYSPAITAGDNTSLAALFAAMTLMSNATTDRNGQFATAASVPNFAWFAVKHSAAPTGVTVVDMSGFNSGFSGAASPGLYSGTDADPLTIYLQWTNPSTGDVWDFYRSNGKAVTYDHFNLS